MTSSSPSLGNIPPEYYNRFDNRARDDVPCNPQDLSKLDRKYGSSTDPGITTAMKRVHAIHIRRQTYELQKMELYELFEPMVQKSKAWWARKLDEVRTEEEDRLREVEQQEMVIKKA